MDLTEILFIIFAAIVIIMVMFFQSRENKQAREEEENFKKFQKAMMKANKYAEPGSIEHAKKTVEILEE